MTIWLFKLNMKPIELHGAVFYCCRRFYAKTHTDKITLCSVAHSPFTLALNRSTFTHRPTTVLNNKR